MSKTQNLPPLEIGYTNHRGETALRRVIPGRAWYGDTKYHPDPQWLLDVWDCDQEAECTYAMKDMGVPMPNATNTTTPHTKTPGAEWRTGNHYGIHVYEGDRPVATFHREEDAARCVAALRAAPAIDTAAQPVAWLAENHTEQGRVTRMERVAEIWTNQGVTVTPLFRSHPASATPEAETLRAEVERLTRELALERSVSGTMEQMRDTETARAQRAEAQVASLTKELTRYHANRPYVVGYEEGKAAQGAEVEHNDYVAHHGDWRRACEIARNHAEPAGVDHDDAAYWQHQIDTLDRLAALSQPAPDGKAEEVDIVDLDRMFANIPAGPYSADARGEAWEVRAIDTDPTNAHHWPYRLCACIAGQKAGCDPDVFGFIAGVINAWPTISAALAPERST